MARRVRSGGYLAVLPLAALFVVLLVAGLQPVWAGAGSASPGSRPTQETANPQAVVLAESLVGEEIPAAVTPASGGTGPGQASASSSVTIRIPPVVRVWVSGEGLEPARLTGASGPAAGASSQRMDSVAVRVRTAPGGSLLRLKVFANTPWALFVAMGEGPEAGVEVSVQPPAGSTGPGGGGSGTGGAQATAQSVSLVPQGPGRVLVRSARAGVTELSVRVAARPAAPAFAAPGAWEFLSTFVGGPVALLRDPRELAQWVPQAQTPAAEVELRFHVVGMGSGTAM